jgi:hypothetical protein
VRTADWWNAPAIQDDLDLRTEEVLSVLLEALRQFREKGIRSCDSAGAGLARNVNAVRLIGCLLKANSCAFYTTHCSDFLYRIVDWTRVEVAATRRVCHLIGGVVVLNICAAVHRARIPSWTPA